MSEAQGDLAPARAKPNAAGGRQPPANRLESLTTSGGFSTASHPQTDYYRLRTEWLRYKSQLFDGLTGLPALPAVVEDVRRIVESCGAADVVYVDLGRSGGHETQLGWAAYDGAVREFAALLGGLHGSGDLAPQDVVCLHTVRSDRFLVFMGVGDTGRSTSVRRDRLVTALRERADAAPQASVLRGLRLSAGHARIHNDPIIRAERAIQQAVAEAVLMSLVEREGVEAVRRDELSRMISQGDVRAVFHPIVRLTDGLVIGHEALTRPVGGISFDSVEELFAFAESTDLLMDFERLCRRTAIATASRTPNLGLLFLNASARAVEDPEWAAGGMDENLRASGFRPHDVVVEITERVAITRHDEFQSALRTFKERGYKVAVDDMGAGYASLQSLASIEPDFLKFDTSLVRNIDKSSIKRSLLVSLRELAEKIRARVIAEGVEREEEARTLRELGIELGQGFLFHLEEPQGA
jgi:EAL domain-containing protein (putative c-di-GMP-specific phosphodiesterase class I)